MSASVAVDWAERQIGTVETSPNWGPKISAWIRASGYGFPVAWCQCFANAVAVAGGAPQPTGQAGYTPHFLMGRYRSQGYVPIPLADAQPGDFVYFDWSMGVGDPCDHVGVFVRREGSYVWCIEGNTSPTSAGSQNNGGGVFLRRRHVSLVPGAVRVPYPTRDAYRNLTIESPALQGSDVLAFQVAINARADACGRGGLEDRGVVEDGEYGPQTKENGAWAAYLLGIGDSTAEIKSGGISPYVQNLVRNPDERNDAQRDRAGERRPRLCNRS